MYSYIHSKGIGTTAAALYVAWAQQFEQLDQHQHADAVYQTAIENQAKPSDTVLQQYRLGLPLTVIRGTSSQRTRPTAHFTDVL